MSGLLLSCSESPFVSKDVIEELIAFNKNKKNPFKDVKNVVATINNDIYFFSHIDSIPKRLTNSPLEKKTNVKLSFDLTRIVYLDENKIPVIIDSDNGQVLEILSEYSNVKQLGWINNDNSIFLLIGNSVIIYGEAVEVVQPEISYPSNEVLSFSMNDIGDQAYYIKSYGIYAGQKLKFDSEVNKIDTLISVLPNEVSGADYINFYDDTGGFFVGYNDYTSNEIEHVSIFNDYFFWPFVDWYDDFIISPVFNSGHEVLIYGYSNGNYNSIKAVYLGTENYDKNSVEEIKTINIDEYLSEYPIYVDWK